MSEPAWTRQVPEKEGWYWIRYKNKRNKRSVCPCLVMHLGMDYMVHTARNVAFSGATRKFEDMDDAEFWPVRLEEPPA